MEIKLASYRQITSRMMGGYACFLPANSHLNLSPKLDMGWILQIHIVYFVAE